MLCPGRTRGFNQFILYIQHNALILAVAAKGYTIAFVFKRHFGNRQTFVFVKFQVAVVLRHSEVRLFQRTQQHRAIVKREIVHQSRLVGIGDQRAIELKAIVIQTVLEQDICGMLL